MGVRHEFSGRKIGGLRNVFITPKPEVKNPDD
jgi:hypothetical protein